MAQFERALIKTTPSDIENIIKRSKGQTDGGDKPDNSFFRVFGLKSNEDYHDQLKSIALDCNTKFIPIDEISELSADPELERDNVKDSNQDLRLDMTSKSTWDAEHHEKLIKLLNVEDQKYNIEQILNKYENDSDEEQGDKRNIVQRYNDAIQMGEGQLGSDKLFKDIEAVMGSYHQKKLVDVGGKGMGKSTG